MTVSCRFVYRFKKHGKQETKEVVVTNVQSRFDAYQIAREEMLEKTGLNIRTFESEWQVEESEIAIGIPDFSQKKALIDHIRGISGVESASQVDNETGRKHEIVFVNLNENIHEDYVIDKIKTFVEDHNSETMECKAELLIIFNPDYYDSAHSED